LTMPVVIDWTAKIGGEVVSNKARAGAIWAIARQTPAEKIVHLIDLRDQSATLWNAARTPWQGGPEPVRIEISLEETISTALIVSPDAHHGRAVSIDFTQANGVVVIEAPIAGPWTTIVLRGG